MVGLYTYIQVVLVFARPVLCDDVCLNHRDACQSSPKLNVIVLK